MPHPMYVLYLVVQYGWMILMLFFVVKISRSIEGLRHDDLQGRDQVSRRAR